MSPEDNNRDPQAKNWPNANGRAIIQTVDAKLSNRNKGNGHGDEKQPLIIGHLNVHCKLRCVQVQPMIEDQPHRDSIPQGEVRRPDVKPI